MFFASLNTTYIIKKLISYAAVHTKCSKKFLLLGSFYSLNEYYEWNKRDDLGSCK
jgi:hypothetical protein